MNSSTRQILINGYGFSDKTSQTRLNGDRDFLRFRFQPEKQ